MEEPTTRSRSRPRYSKNPAVHGVMQYINSIFFLFIRIKDCARASRPQNFSRIIRIEGYARASRPHNFARNISNVSILQPKQSAVYLLSQLESCRPSGVNCPPEQDITAHVVEFMRHFEHVPVSGDTLFQLCTDGEACNCLNGKTSSDRHADAAFPM